MYAVVVIMVETEGVYPPSVVADVVDAKFSYLVDDTVCFGGECEYAQAHNWWLTSIFTSQCSQRATARYTCAACMRRVKVVVDLPSLKFLEYSDPDDVVDELIDYDGFTSKSMI